MAVNDRDLLTGNTAQNGNGGAAASADTAAAANTRSYADAIQTQYDAAAEQQSSALDRSTRQSIENTERSYSEKAAQAKTEYGETTAGMLNAMDNQALTDRVGGSLGGTAAMRLSAVQGAWQQKRRQLALSQQRLAADTLAQVENLRAQGAFDQADALLQNRQQLFQALYQDAVRVDDNLTANQQYEQQLQQQEQQAAQKREQSRIEWLREAGMELLENGSMPTDAMLEAMGLDAATAKTYVYYTKLGL